MTDDGMTNAEGRMTKEELSDLRMQFSSFVIRHSLLIAARGELDVFVNERLLVADRFAGFAAGFPRGDVREVRVVTQRFAVGRLIFFTEMAAARFAAFQGVETHQLAELQEIGDAAGFLQRLI